MFNPVDTKTDFAAMERDILDWWERNDIPTKYMQRNSGADKIHSFIDGPITANNPMGVHHAWGRSYKDIFLRFRAMQGYDQRYQNGFDGQGLWIEVEVEKELGFKSKRDIEAFGVGKFVDMCKQRVDRFADIISQQSIRLGYWMDWDDSYHTKSDENNYTIWHFLKTCHQKGWLYEGRDVMPWCPRCGTGLSEHEIVTEGYKEIVHPGLFVKFPLINVPSPSMGEGQDGGEESKESLLVWTTTPWTLTANAAAAVHPEKTYIKVRQGDDTLYLIKERASVLKGDYEVLGELPASELVGARYRAPFAELPVQEGVEHRVVAWDEVSESEGTGIVHIAPGAGKEDFELGNENGIPAIAPLDEYGDFVDGFDWLTGRNVYDTNDDIYDSLKSKGVFYNLERYSHRYPVCWRCDSELVFRLVDEWFISMGEKHDKPREELTGAEKADSLRYQIMDVVDDIRWVPEFGYARELDWLRNMDDWMISKKRYYGLALPIYKCAECGWFDVIGSETELQCRAVEGWDEFAGNSPHRPWVDSVKIRCDKCGATVSRIEDVGNAWLDAGIVSFSTIQYRHDQEYWRKWFPADWISESFPGQFRNWFYSLLTMSTVLENTAPFKSVFSYALMRDDKGEEMHKSKGNAIWFEDAAERMGVDAMRWVFLRQNPALNINFGFRSADEVRRRFIIPLWNVYSFFVTYANIDRYDATATPPPISERAELDRWILSELNQLVREVTDAFENFDPDRAARHVEGFVEYLSNWYVRRSRRRFWKAGILAENADADKHGAYATLYECLLTLIKLIAPVTPFMTEQMYGNLTNGQSKESVHLDDFPVADESLIDQRLSDATRLAMRLSSMGRAARSKAGLKVRQPLEHALVRLRSTDEVALLSQVAPQVQDELNVKQIEPVTDEGDVLEYKVQPNLRLLGPKYGAKLRNIVAALNEANPAEIHGQVRSGNPVAVNGVVLEPDEVLVETLDKDGYAVTNEGGYTVAVSTEVSDALKLEGDARELVHGIQNMRRSADFDIADHIVTYYESSPELHAVIAAHGDYIRQETLSQELVSQSPADDAYTETLKVNAIQATIGVRRAE
ncbi:MAG: isoleucine--tRNA ligase [Chloroflexota bacterium]|nr:isoleucine--tRNA ligase [Chloroflexota bacterium]